MAEGAAGGFAGRHRSRVRGSSLVAHARPLSATGSTWYPFVTGVQGAIDIGRTWAPAYQNVPDMTVPVNYLFGTGGSHVARIGAMNSTSTGAQDF